MTKGYAKAYKGGKSNIEVKPVKILKTQIIIVIYYMCQLLVKYYQ